jgi:flagellar basal body-associated protein FliL
MRPLLFLSNAFINTFGITQPTPKNERRTAWFIAIMLLLVVALVATVAAIVLHIAFHR